MKTGPSGVGRGCEVGVAIVVGGAIVSVGIGPVVEAGMLVDIGLDWVGITVDAGVEVRESVSVGRDGEAGSVSVDSNVGAAVIPPGAVVGAGIVGLGNNGKTKSVGVGAEKNPVGEHAVTSKTRIERIK